MVRWISQKVAMEHFHIEFSEIINANEEREQRQMLILPCKEKQGEHGPGNMNRELNRQLPENKKAQTIYTVTKLGSKFTVKYVTKPEPQMIDVRCSLETFDKSYNDEIGRMLA